MKNQIKRRVCATAVAAVTACLIALPASAVLAQTAKLVAGNLTCSGKGNVGAIIGSQQTFQCLFDPAGKGPKQTYRGVITKVGLDIGFTGASTIIWTVLAATERIPTGALVGDYGGVSADAAVVVGAGANALIGGSNKSIVLQPFSVQGQTGLNLAVGVSQLSLRRD